MSDTDFAPLVAPAAHGQEFLRAALDGDGQLVLSLRGAPLQSDPRLWGCALGDIASAAARHHVECERHAANDTSILPRDYSDEHDALQQIGSQFADELRLAYPGCAPTVLTDYATKACPEVDIGTLEKGDRFAYQNSLFIVSRPTNKWIGTMRKPIITTLVAAVNLATGETIEIRPPYSVRAVRIKRDQL